MSIAKEKKESIDWEQNPKFNCPTEVSQSDHIAYVCSALRLFCTNLVLPRLHYLSTIIMLFLQENPYFPTKNAPPSGVGAVNPDPNATRNPGSILGILLGSGLTAFAVAIAIVVSVIAALAYSRHRRRRNSLVRSVSTDSDEKTRLV